MGALRRTLLLASLFAVACGGPLDRVDGRLLIKLRVVPTAVDRIEVEVRAGGRRFEESLGRDLEIDVFSAVPVGPAEIDVRLFIGDTMFAERLGVPVVVVEGAVVPVEVSFGDPPRVSIDAPSAHFVGDGPISIDVIEVARDRDVDLQVTAGGRVVSATPLDRRWDVLVDPLIGSSIVPYQLELVADVCYADLPPTCSTSTAAVRVHREVWRQTIGDRGSLTPVQSGSRIVRASDDGSITIHDLESGEVLGPTITAPAPLTVGMAVRAGVVFVVDGNNDLFGVTVDTGVRTTWTVNLGATRASDVVVAGDRLIVGAGRRLLAIDPNDGMDTDLFVASAAIRARPWVDTLGIVAADVQGHVVVLDDTDGLVQDVRLDAPVRAGPARVGDRIWVATLDGRLLPIDNAGVVGTAIETGEPIAHPLLLRSPTSFVAASGSSLVFVTGVVASSHRLAAPITGAPTAFLSQVVVGLRSGLAVVVAEDGRQRVLSRVDGVALGMAPIVGVDSDLVVTGTRGEFGRLRAEEGFGP